MKPSSPEIEARLVALAAYFEAQSDGEYLAWDRIEAETGQPMRPNSHGRNLARRALSRLKRRYESVRGEGLRLSSSDNAIRIVENGFTKIDRTVRNADRVQRDLSNRHLEQMSSTDKQKMAVAAGFFGAIRTFVKSKGQIKGREDKQP